MSSPRSISLLCLFALVLAVSADYNTPDANEYASASALAYCNPSAITSWSCGLPCKNLTGYQSYFTEVFSVGPGETLSFSMIFNPSSKRFISAFRGTASTVQLLLEILEGDAVSYGLADISGALVDDYFYTHYVSALRPAFISLITDAYKTYPDYKFIFTGHSLGGALTTIAAFDVISSGVIPSSQVLMYTYGSPRVGNHILAQKINAAVPEIYRVVHWKDMVPHVPPCVEASIGGQCVTGDMGDDASVLWAAWHVEKQIFYNEANTEYQICSAEDPSCMDQFTLGQTNTGDHSYYVDIAMGCDGTSATSFGPGQDKIGIKPEMMKKDGMDILVFGY